MKIETRQCQNCKSEFVIEPEDFLFYEKIKVPPPTWCPECRLKRRMLFRNEMVVYKRKCDFTAKDIFSPYAPEKPVKVYDNEIWYSDHWDPLDYGRAYDFSRSFFEQFGELLRSVPKLGRSVLRLVDSDYCNNASDLRRCYLLFNSELSEDCAYGNGITSCQDVYDSYFMKQVERGYEGFVCLGSYNVFFSADVHDSHDIYFSKDLVGCAYCIGCANLRNKEYHIFNKPYSRETFFDALREFGIGSYRSLSELRERCQRFQLRFPVKFMHGRHNVNVSGDYITSSRNVLHSFFIDEFEDCKYCYWMGLKPTKDCYDFCWGGAAELVYEAVAVGYQIGNLRFAYECWPGCFDSTYCAFCSSNVRDCFGCVGLRNKQYCILNKQYTKEEYEKLVSKIIQHMNEMPYVDGKGRVYRYGEFFPPELSPFAYNETIAQEYFPLTKEQALEQGYTWRDPELRQYEVAIHAKDLRDNIKDVKDTILKETIGCLHEGKCNEQCTTAFKIIPQELGFYRKMNLPLPRLCSNCRHYQRLKQRNPLKLWHRQCTCGGDTSENGVYSNQTTHFHGSPHCPNEFETSYAPERPEIVYCESCYQDEVI